eukprot:9492762-Pyramimonas_sp.AAC.1
MLARIPPIGAGDLPLAHGAREGPPAPPVGPGVDPRRPRGARESSTSRRRAKGGREKEKAFSEGAGPAQRSPRAF